MLNVVDDVTQECLAAILDTSISGRRVVRELRALIEPGMIVSDNGTELTSNAILRWCSDHRIESHYTAPGKPMRDTVSSKASTDGCAMNCSTGPCSETWLMRVS